MRVSHSAYRVMPALLLSLVTAIPLLSQSSASGAKSKSAQDNWDAPTQTAPSPQGSKAGKADTKNVADGAAKGQASEGIVKERDMSSPSINGADGAAKGQATEGIDRNPNGGSGGKGNRSSVNDHKNISDGAAKSQAVDGMARNPNGGSGGGKGNNTSIIDSKNISDGAAKGQATDGIIRSQDSSSPGKDVNGVADNLKSKSGTDDWNAPTATAAQGSGSGTGKTDSINYNASKSNTGSITVHKTIDSASPTVAGDPPPQPGMAVKGQGVPENAKGTKKSATDDWQAPTSTAPPAAGTTKGKSATDDWQSSK